MLKNVKSYEKKKKKPAVENVDDKDLSRPPIREEEIIRVTNTSKERKAIGKDRIPVELLKLLDDKSITVLQMMFNNTGEYPAKWLTSNFVLLPKKNNATKCENHRLIGLRSYTLKIIHYRISIKCERNIASTQFGFRQGLGTREALIAIQILIQNCNGQRKDIML